MKHIYLFIFILFSFLFASCSDSNEEVVLEVKPESLEFVKESITKTVSIKTNDSSWTATVDPAGRDWCTTATDGNTLQVTVTENIGNDIRETSIKITAGSLSQNVTVKQLGADPAILVSTASVNVKAEGAKISFDVTANVAYSFSGLPDWIEEVTSATRAGMVTTTHTFSVAQNTSGKSRPAIILIENDKGTCRAQVKINQESDVYQPGESGVKDDIKIQVLRGEASSFHNGTGPEGGIELSFDGKMDTWYHSQWSGKVKDGYFPITLDYYLKDAAVLDYLVYRPRTDHSNGNFKEVDILVKYKDKNSFELVLAKDFEGSSTARRIEFSPALENVDAIRFSVKSGVGDDNHGFASCAEMEFYKKNTDNFNPLTLFTDVTCTALRPGITEDQIAACDYPLFRDVALHLLKGTYPAEFRIAEYKAYPHPDDESKANKTSQYSLVDNPTGISVKSGEELIVLVGPTNGHLISLRLQNLDEPGGDGFYTATNYALIEGVNKINVPTNGLLYIMYHTPRFDTAPAVKIHIPSGTVNGYYDSTKHTNPDDWNRLLSNATDKHFDVVGKYAHLTFPTDRFRAHTKGKGRELIDAYDRIVYLQMEHMGLKKYNRMFHNRMYFCVMYGSYMYASSYHTAYNDGTLTELCDYDLVSTSAIWGPAHEVGHVNQTRPGFRWVGMAEVTNNVHSMYVQREFGNPTRLQTESMAGEGGFVNRYEKAMNFYFRTGRPHCFMTTPTEKDLVDVFCKLVPLWQLQLYVADARGNTDFYKDFYEMVRNEPNMANDAGHQLEFTVRACKAAKMDLTRFFEKWGFLTEVDVVVEDYSPTRMVITKSMIDDTKARIKALGYSEPVHRFEYICDDNVDVFKSTATIGRGSAKRSGKKVTLTGWTNVAAFEVRDGDKLIFVSSESSFTLDHTISAWSDNYKLYAISSTGEEVEVNF